MNKAGCANTFQGYSVWITYNATPKCALQTVTAVYDPDRDLRSPYLIIIEYY